MSNGAREFVLANSKGGERIRALPLGHFGELPIWAASLFQVRPDPDEPIDDLPSGSAFVYVLVKNKWLVALTTKNGKNVLVKDLHDLKSFAQLATELPQTFADFNKHVCEQIRRMKYGFTRELGAALDWDIEKLRKATLRYIAFEGGAREINEMEKQHGAALMGGLIEMNEEEQP